MAYGDQVAKEEVLRAPNMQYPKIKTHILRTPKRILKWTLLYQKMEKMKNNAGKYVVGGLKLK